MVQWHVLDWVSLIVQNDWIMSHRVALELIDIPFPSQTNDCFQVKSQSQNDPRNRALQKKEDNLIRRWERSCNYRRHWSRYDDNITCVYVWNKSPFTRLHLKRQAHIDPKIALSCALTYATVQFYAYKRMKWDNDVIYRLQKDLFTTFFYILYKL